MHEYYQKNYAKLKKSMDGYLKLISAELQQVSGKDYDLMVLSYERTVLRIPGFARRLAGRMFNSPKILNKMFQKKDKQNAANAEKNPGSFETKTMIPPEEGYQ